MRQTLINWRKMRGLRSISNSLVLLTIMFAGFNLTLSAQDCGHHSWGSGPSGIDGNIELHCDFFKK